MFRRSLTAGSLFLVCGCLLMTGCSNTPAEEPKLNVVGKVTQGGQPLHLDPAMAAAKAARVEVRFIRQDQGNANLSETAFAEPDGTFKVQLPAGTYRVGIQHFDGGSEDKLGGKFDERQSTITREVKTEGQQINIDLDHPEAS